MMTISNNVGPYTPQSVAPFVKHSPSPDSQAHRVYNAEHSIRGKPITLAGAREYVEAITITRWWRNRATQRVWNLKVAHEKRDNPATADYWNSTIWLPEWAREPVTILHEVTHILHACKRTNQAWHGPEFAWLECHMMKRFEPTLYEKLKKAFNSYEVETKRPSFSVTRYWLL